jgi:hypothetical protein
VAICSDTGALAGEACPNTRDELFISGTEPKTSDVVFRTVRVAGDGACLAASYTPAEQAHDETFTVYPPEFHDWAIGAGIPQPPTSFCPPPSQPNTANGIAQIAQPMASATITTTQVFVRGTARGTYTLEFGVGRDPAEWQPIASGAGVADGILGVWQTGGLAAGEYTLRLRVTTPDGAPVESRVVIRVGPTF